MIEVNQRQIKLTRFHGLLNNLKFTCELLMITLPYIIVNVPKLVLSSFAIATF
jgi:hypothetical protein